MMRTSKVYSLRNTQICNAGLRTLVTTPHITAYLFCRCQCVPFDPFNPLALQPPPLSIAKLFSVPMGLFFFFFRFYVSVRSYGIRLSLSDVFHLAQGPRGPSRCCEWRGFLLFSGRVIVTCVVHLTSLSIRPSMDT